MKKTLSASQILVLVLLTAIFSCKKDVSIKNAASSIIEKNRADSNFVSFNRASTAARQIKNSHMVSDIIKQKEINSINLPFTKSVLDSIALPNSVSPSYYVFNYQGGGFVIIPVDRRVEPVLAYSSKGYFPHSLSLPQGLSTWLTINDKNMQRLRKDTSLKVPRGVAELWKELLPQYVNATGGKILDVAQPPPPTCQDTYNINIIGPFLQTTWA